MADRAKHPLKICMVGDATSIHFLRWTKMFQERGHEIVALSPRIPEAFPAPCHCIEPVHPIPFLRTFQRILKTRSLVARIKPEVVIGQYLVQFGWCSAFSGKALKSVMAWGSDISPLVKRTSFDEWMNRCALSKFGFVVAWSEFLKKAFMLYGMSEDRVIRVNFPPSSIPDAQGCETFDEAFGHDNLVPGEYLVSIRGMNSVYNHETIIESIPIILESYPKMKFVFLLYSVNKDYQARIEAMVQERGVGKSVVFLKGQSITRFATLCRNSLATISVSKSDGMPLSVLEALSMGVPLIAGRIPPIEEIIRHDVNGFIIDLYSSKQLAECVGKLAENPSLRPCFAAYNRNMIAEFINPEYGIERIEKKVSLLISSK